LLRHVTRLVATLFVDYSASRRLVVDYSASRRLVVDYSTSRRLVVDYFASAACMGASARRAARHTARGAARRRLLLLA
jgi:transposase-like protein